MKNHNEDALQIACVNWFTYQFKPIANALHHSPNGGFRHTKEAARFKDMGVRAGFPDLVLFVKRHGYGALCIELKVGKNKQTDHQKEYQALLEQQGYRYEVVRSFDEFVELINEYLKNEQNERN